MFQVAEQFKKKQKTAVIKSGFSLMEMIIYVAILGLVVSAMIIFAITLSNNQSKAYSASEVESNAEIILQEISALIRAARSFDEVVSVWDNDQGVLVGNFDEAGSSWLKISLIDGRVRAENSDNETYFLSSRTVGISRLRFSKMATGQIFVDFAVSYGAVGAELTPDKKYEQQVKIAITVR